jgi:hypothetical protein
MSLPLPKLDDSSYADLRAEALARLPALAPTWTDHNPSDPGITLIELFAWLSEMILYRLDQVPDASYEAFLRLLNGPNWERQADLSIAIRDTVLKLRERYRAVTANDYELLALADWPRQPQAARYPAIRRARAVPNRNLESGRAAQQEEEPAHMSLVIVPEPSGADDQHPLPPDGLIDGLWDYLDERRVLTIRHHVVGPQYVKLDLEATLRLQPDAQPEKTRALAENQLRAFFHPHAGWKTGAGWPFGRAVYLSEIYELFDTAAGVNYVEDVALITGDATREQRNDANELVGLTLFDDELVGLNRIDLKIIEAI